MPGGPDPLGDCVLLVDDEPMIVEVVAAQLQEMGRTVCGSAATAAEAVRRAELHRPALVLMDMRLEGDEDGVDAALAIRARVGSAVIFITASTDAITLARIETAKPSAVLFKPVATQVLKAAIEDALFERHGHQPAHVDWTNGDGAPAAFSPQTPLTGLVTRDDFERMIAESVARPRDHADELVISILELRNLVEIRGAEGPGRVERLLQLMAYRLSNFASPSGCATRLADERFAMFGWLRQGDGSAREALLRREACRPYRLGGRELHPDCAIRVVVCPPTNIEADIAPAEIARQLILRAQDLFDVAVAGAAPRA